MWPGWRQWKWGEETLTDFREVEVAALQDVVTGWTDG